MSQPVLLSFDVEDWFQVENLRPSFPPDTWDAQELRVAVGVGAILGVLAQHRVRATFFVLGWIARRLPELVERIAAAGHEIASHGTSHVMPTSQGVDEFRADVREARELLESLTGRKVRGYRAPSFAIDDERLRILFEEHHDYDSSYNPVSLHDRYGRLEDLGAEVAPEVFEVPGGGFEFTIPLARYGPLSIPAGGGGYFRLYPPALFRTLARRARSGTAPVLLYLHPWEFDPGQPRVTSGISASSRFRHYNNLSRTESRLGSFIDSFKRRDARFLPMSEYLDELAGPARQAMM